MGIGTAVETKILTCGPHNRSRGEELLTVSTTVTALHSSIEEQLCDRGVTPQCLAHPEQGRPNVSCATHRTAAIS